MHLSPGLVARHSAHDRRHCAAPGVPGRPSDRPQHESDTEEFPQGVERRVGSNRLRAGPPDGRRQRRHEDVRFLRAALRGSGAPGRIFPRRGERIAAGNPDRK